jgi:hypothetical protein
MSPPIVSKLAACFVLVSTVVVNASVDIDDDWFRAPPPVDAAYSFGANLRQGTTRFGSLDTLTLHAGDVEHLKLSDRFDVLVGADWQRIDASVPANAPVPSSLQWAAAVIGFDWKIGERWRTRLEAAPGIYNEWRDFNGDDFNVPLNGEISYLVNPRLLIGFQFNADARRDTPVVALPAVRWKFAERWLLSLWAPRPQIEYAANQKLTLFGGGVFQGGTFALSHDFGRRHGRIDLDNQFVEFRQIQLGVGARYHATRRFAVEVSGGWGVDRRYEFHSRNLQLVASGAPSIQAGFGLTF